MSINALRDSSIISGVIVAIGTTLLNIWLISSQIIRSTSSKEHWLLKKQFFLESINLIDRLMNSTAWSGDTFPKSYVQNIDLKPSVHEINQICAKLALVAENQCIVTRFSSFFTKGSSSSPVDRAKYIKALRKDLFRNDNVIDKKHPHFFLMKQNDNSSIQRLLPPPTESFSQPLRVFKPCEMRCAGCLCATVTVCSEYRGMIHHPDRGGRV